MSKIQQLKDAGIEIIEAESNEAQGYYAFRTATPEQWEFVMSIIQPQPVQTEQVFLLPIYAPDFIVQSPKPKADPRGDIGTNRNRFRK
jgi:hypothetical protein